MKKLSLLLCATLMTSAMCALENKNAQENGYAKLSAFSFLAGFGHTTLTVLSKTKLRGRDFFAAGCFTALGIYSANEAAKLNALTRK